MNSDFDLAALYTSKGLPNTTDGKILHDIADILVTVDFKFYFLVSVEIAANKYTGCFIY